MPVLLILTYGTQLAHGIWRELLVHARVQPYLNESPGHYIELAPGRYPPKLPHLNHPSHTDFRPVD